MYPLSPPPPHLFFVTKNFTYSNTQIFIPVSEGNTLNWIVELQERLG